MHQLYKFDVEFWYFILFLVISLVLIGHANHVQTLCGDFGQHQLVLSNQEGFGGATYIGE